MVLGYGGMLSMGCIGVTFCLPENALIYRQPQCSINGIMEVIPFGLSLTSTLLDCPSSMTGIVKLLRQVDLPLLQISMSI